MDKTVPFYLLRMIDTAVGIGFEKELYACIFRCICNYTVVAGFGEWIFLLKVLHHTVAAIPGASGGGYDGFVVVQSYAVVVGEHVQVGIFKTQPLLEFWQLSGTIAIITVDKADPFYYRRNKGYSIQVTEDKTSFVCARQVFANSKLSKTKKYLL
jgi:hypothetical protein